MDINIYDTATVKEIARALGIKNISKDKKSEVIKKINAKMIDMDKYRGFSINEFNLETDNNNSKKTNYEFLSSNQNERYETIILTSSKVGDRDLRFGAKNASEELQDSLIIKADDLFKCKTKKEIIKSTNEILHEYNGYNDENLINNASYCLVDKKLGMTMIYNLGNNAIVGVNNGKYKVLSYPIDGADDKIKSLLDEIDIADAKIYQGVFDAVTILSDGTYNEIYDGETINSQIKKMLINENYDDIKKFLGSKNLKGNSSFISLNHKVIEKTLENNRLNNSEELIDFEDEER